MVPRKSAGMKDTAGTDKTREQDVDFEECYPGFPGWLTVQDCQTAFHCSLTGTVALQLGSFETNKKKTLPMSYERSVI